MGNFLNILVTILSEMGKTMSFFTESRHVSLTPGNKIIGFDRKGKRKYFKTINIEYLVPMSLLMGISIMLFNPKPGWSQAATNPVPTVSTTSNGTPASSALAPLTPDQEIQILEAIDAQSNSTSAISASSENPLPAVSSTKPQQAQPIGAKTPEMNGNTTTPTAVVTGPPPIPTGLNDLILKEGVYLSWNSAPPGSPIVGYNVYRSNQPGTGYQMVNLKPLNVAFFLDGPPNSLNPPKNGETYFYVVASIDAQGNVSPYSEEISAQPQGMQYAAATEEATPVPTHQKEEEKTLNIPESKLINLQLPADTQLSIQGYKKIEVQLGFQTFNRPQTINGLSNSQNTQLVNQELVVNLDGKVGKNVDIHVDYSDVNRAGGVDQSKQEISIAYHGDENSPVQEVDFGDLQLLLPNTEFAGFSKQLFGLQAKLKFDNFKMTTFFAQTKGISETKVFTGNSSQVDKTYNDIDYIRQKYYLLTKKPYPNGSTTINVADLPKPNSEQIWVNPSNGSTAFPSGPNYIGYFQHWLPGRDYTVDYTTGVITFITGLSSTAQIAIGYNDQTGQKYGLNDINNIANILSQPSSLLMNPNGLIDDTHVLIKNNDNTSSPFYMVDYYDLGHDKIIPPNQDPNFLLEIIDQGTNNVLQEMSNGPISYYVNQDLNLLSVYNANNDSVSYTTTSNGTAVTVQGNFEERAFVDSSDPALGTSINGIYNENTVPTSLKRIHIRYKTQLNFYSLNRFNIIKGSEAVYLDGRRLRRDVDYTIDYTSGFLDFVDKSILRTDSQVVVTYEYSPFGSFAQENILGARAEYDLTDHFFVGSTFLYSSTQTPIDQPQIGSTPNSLTLLDADAKYDLGSEDVQSLTGLIPGLADWKPPVAVKLSGEVAESFFDPNSYNAEGETGVAMLDSMEGIDNVIGPNLNATNWIASSPPLAVPAYLPITVCDGSCTVSTNNRIRFMNQDDTQYLQTLPATVTGINGAGGHLYQQTGNATDEVSVLMIPYANLNNQKWGGIRQILSTSGEDLSTTTFLQAWIYNDNPANDKWVMVDFGIMDEAVAGLSSGATIENEWVSNGGTPVWDDYGIPAYYSNIVGALGVTLPAIGGPNSSSNYISNENNTSTQEGARNLINDTEDVNANGNLDGNDQYFEYGIRANWSGWKLVKIPVNFSAVPGQNTTDEGVDYFYNVVGAASSALIREIRLWVTGASPAPISGYFLVDSIGFTHNLWQDQVDPNANLTQGVTVNTSKFDATSISQIQDSAYQPTQRFIVLQEGQNQNTVLENEKSLRITYNLSTADMYVTNIPGPVSEVSEPDYYCTRSFGQGLDLTDYQNLAFDLNVRTAVDPGEILFIRLANDQLDYYQYNVPLVSGGGWQTISLLIDGSQGNRQTVGTPFINRTAQISIGIISPNPVPGGTKELWIDNLRTNNPNQRSGLARRANAAVILGNNFATLNGRYREVDSGFTEMDQTSTHFQHSKQLGADYSSSGIKLFGQPLATQASYTVQDLTTEQDLLQNPYYSPLPNTHTENATGSISYTKDLGTSYGKITNLRLSGSSNYEDDEYQPAYLTQPGIQGDTTKTDQTYTLASTYDAPLKLFNLPIGTNQLNGTYTLTHDTQDFGFNTFAPYDRTTKTQTYGWINTTEILKNLVFTPGYTFSETDAKGNTNSPGIAGGVGDYTTFQDRYQPKGGLVFRGIPGMIPSIDYSGSNQYDYESFPDGPRFNNANNFNSSLNLTPGSWLTLFQKANLTVFAGLTESATSSVPDFTLIPPLTFSQKWLINPPFGVALNATESTSKQLNMSFKIFDFWDVKPTGSWTNQLSLLSKGSNAVSQEGRTMGGTTVYNHPILSLPLIKFNLTSAQFQFTHTDNTQYDSSGSGIPANQTYSDLYSVTLPYEINKKAQGNFHYQLTKGFQNVSDLITNQYDSLFSLEYDQKFLENQYLHIPFTNWKIKFTQALEFRATFTREWVDNESLYVTNVLKTERYRGQIDLNYNALKNLRVGLTLAYENFNNIEPNPNLGYNLIQVNLSAEARF